jgi:hypothetical protein
MELDNLLKLIRKEEVAIWAGAGFSLYAGFPSGKQLCEILLESLTESERQKIDANLRLPDLTEQYFRIKGDNSNALITVLKKTYLDFIPKNTNYHDNLALIPHFKTIITTNYDQLFENALGKRGNLIFSDEHIPYLDKSKTQIFKVHGDLSKPNSIIISNSDYEKFFKNRKEYDVFWTVIKERLSTNNVLFVGYGLEDPNISVIFDKITESLETNRKECFLVAPDLPSHKVSQLIKKGIHYINLSGEELILKIVESIKKNIVIDFEKGDVSPETLRKFLLNFHMKPNLKSSENKYLLDEINATKEGLKGSLDLQYKYDEIFNSAFERFIKGEEFGNFEINSDFLINTEINIEGIRLNEPKSISKVTFKSVPKFDDKIDISFQNGFEVLDVPLKVFSSPKMIEAHFHFKCGVIKMNFLHPKNDKINYKFYFEHTENFINVNAEISIYSLLLNLARSEPFSIYVNNKEVINKALPENVELAKSAQFYLKHAKNLKLIEKYYNVRFNNFSIKSIEIKDVGVAERLVLIIQGKQVLQEWYGELIFTLENNSKNIIEQFKTINKKKSILEILNQEEEIIELHGQKMNIGYCKIEIQDCLVTNLESIIKGESLEAIFISQSKMAYASYNNFKPQSKNKISIKSRKKND